MSDPTQLTAGDLDQLTALVVSVIQVEPNILEAVIEDGEDIVEPVMVASILVVDGNADPMDRFPQILHLVFDNESLRELFAQTVDVMSEVINGSTADTAPVGANENGDK